MSRQACGMMTGRAGFMLVEILVGLGMLCLVTLAILNYLSMLSGNTQVYREEASRDRVTSGIRTFAGMPAALRNSMRASEASGTLINPQLNSCLGGSPPNSCQSGQLVPMTLYSPLVAFAPNGTVLGVQPITAPVGSSTPRRFDNFGAPCSQPGPYCALEVFTSFVPQCGPAPLPAPPPPLLSPNLLVPMSTCTVADVIQVNFQIQLDPAYLKSLPGLAAFVTPLSGSVVTSAFAISGNSPQ